MISDLEAPIVRRFPLGKIHVDANARQVFDQAKLQELADSLKDTKGVLQPLLGTLREDGDVDLIAGERRLRASELAGFPDVEVKIVPRPTLKDRLKWNLVENLIREDLRPLEKARRVKELLELTDEGTGQLVYNRATLAEELGISADSVARYENILKTSEKLQKEVDEGKLDILIGALIGGLPAGLHERAEKEIVFRHWGGPMRRDEAQKHVAEHYRRDLRKGQFNREDGELVPDAGPCSGCPYFGGNREDVPGKARGYTCLNPECFDRKQQAFVDRAARLAEESGTKVLPQTLTNKVFQSYNNTVNPASGYVELKAVPDGYLLKNPDGDKPTWEKILKGAGVPEIVAFDHAGQVRRLAEVKVAVEAAKLSDHAGLFKKTAAAAVESPDSKKNEMQITKAKNKAQKAVLLEGLGEMFQAFTSQGWSNDVRLVLLRDICSNQTKDDLELLCQILQPDLKGSSGTHKKLEELMEAKLDTAAKLDGFLLIARNIRSIHFNGFHYTDDSSYRGEDDMRAYCRWAGFDADAWDKKMGQRIKDAERDAKAAIKEKAKAEKVKKPVKAEKAPAPAAAAKPVSDDIVVLREYTAVAAEIPFLVADLLTLDIPVTEPSTHGIFSKRACVRVRASKDLSFAIELAHAVDGRWSYGYEYSTWKSDGAVGDLPSDDELRASRASAVQTAAVTLRDKLWNQGNVPKIHREAQADALHALDQVIAAARKAIAPADKGEAAGAGMFAKGPVKADEPPADGEAGALVDYGQVDVDAAAEAVKADREAMGRFIGVKPNRSDAERLKRWDALRNKILRKAGLK
jgi:ParB/RepB/Spo0J family partition protein